MTRADRQEGAELKRADREEAEMKRLEDPAVQAEFAPLPRADDGLDRYDPADAEIRRMLREPYPDIYNDYAAWLGR